VPRQRSRSWRPLAAYKGQRPGRRPLPALAVRRTIGKPSCARPIVMIGAKKSKLPDRWAGRRPGALRPERRASLRARVSAVLPSRDESRRLGDDALISHGRLAWQAPEVENYLVQSRGTAVDCGPPRTETGARPAGSATFLRPAKRPPSCSGAGHLLVRP
jgi:hypothetical protein